MARSRDKEQQRVALGNKLRSHRLIAGRSVVDVARAADMSPSKLSRIELGRVTVSDADIRTIAGVLGLEQDAVDHLVARAMMLTHDPTTENLQRVFTVTFQEGLSELEKAAADLRYFACATIPGLLQIPPYIKGIHAAYTNSRYEYSEQIPPDLNDYLVQRARRQTMLLDQRKYFSFLITESALRQRHCVPSALAGVS